MLRVRRLLVFAAAAWLVLALAPAVLADDPSRDPRCADWEQHGAPAGIDLRLVCTATGVIGAYTGQSEADINSDPLMPYAAGALVTGIALAVVGVLAMRFVGHRAGARLAPSDPTPGGSAPRASRSTPRVARPATRATSRAGRPWPAHPIRW